MDKKSLTFVALLTLAFFGIHYYFDGKKQTSSVPPPQKAVGITETPEVSADIQEQFYTLENPLQQIVFSTSNGSIVEINLPFSSKDNASVVRPISFDYSLAENRPDKDKFPLRESKVVNKEGATVSLPRKTGGYYPLLRRSQSAPDNLNALNILSEDTAESAIPYQVTKFTENMIVFEAKFPSRKIIKTYTLPHLTEKAPYCLDVKIQVEGDQRGLWITTGVPEVELVSGSPAPVLKYRMSSGKKASVEKLSLPSAKKPAFSLSSVYPDWICNSNGFFGLILDPLGDISSGLQADMIPGALDPTRLTLIDANNNRFPAEKYPGYLMKLPLPKRNESHFRFFAGPFSTNILKTVDATYTDPSTGYSPNYVECQSYHGWFSFISEPFAKLLFFLMNLFHNITGSWGFSIILLTLALRLMLYPLNEWSIKSTIKMQEITPLVSKIQEKYKKDPKRVQIETMKLYREKGANPFTGCIPLLIQMPFLIGMFDLLKSTFELRGVPFIPGWINNLTAPDALFSWKVALPFLGTSFHLLPFILGGIMYLQQRLSTILNKQQAVTLTDQQKQQQKMGTIMTLVFTFLFYHFPSGLNLYWISSMLLAILQQWYSTYRYHKKKSTIAAA